MKPAKIMKKLLLLLRTVKWELLFLVINIIYSITSCIFLPLLIKNSENIILYIVFQFYGPCYFAIAFIIYFIKKKVD